MVESFVDVLWKVFVDYPRLYMDCYIHTYIIILVSLSYSFAIQHYSLYMMTVHCDLVLLHSC